jgi:hypothetical protein
MGGYGFAPARREMRRRCVLALYVGVGALAGAKRLAAKCFPFGADCTIKLLGL